ncbi:MAG: glycosyltransferase family 2 protein [Tannerella sp.]|jgi:GT2 family glycosyltransferase|nr:glycosyltransferase family 2 protein [Tannerella sp.]
MSRQIELSVVTINYNGVEDTLELIYSLRKYLTVQYEIIVVDNASDNDEVSIINQMAPDCITIANDKNIGFSGGNNIGIKKATGRYILMLNNDTIVKDDSVQKLITFMDANPQIGGVSPKLLYAEASPDIIQYAGATELSMVTLRNKTIGQGEIDKGQYNESQKTSFLHGAAMMIRREAIEKAGLMPEVFFLYYEEIDWSTQIEKNGFELWYNPVCSIYHKESRSVGSESPLKIYYMTRNRLLYAWRNRLGLAKILSFIYLFGVAATRNTIKYLLRGDLDLARSVVCGGLAFIKLKNKLN